MVAGVRGLGVDRVVLLALGPPFVSASGGCLVLGAELPRRHLLKRASKRPGERGACAFACPPASSPPISPVSPPSRVWHEAPAGSAGNLNLACEQGAPLGHTVRLRGTAVFGGTGGFEIRAVLRNIFAICCHGTEGYLALRGASISLVICVLPRPSLCLVSNMRLVHVQCGA